MCRNYTIYEINLLFIEDDEIIKKVNNRIFLPQILFLLRLTYYSKIHSKSNNLHLITRFFY